MSAHLYEFGVSYISVPKCGCTSLKMLCFEIENGFEFRDFVTNGGHFHIHHFYGSPPFQIAKEAAELNNFKFTVIRSPVDRIKSCYNHWVVSEYGREVMLNSASITSQIGIPVQPNFSEFVDHLEAYRSAFPNISHHTEKLSYFLGSDSNYFNAVYEISKISDAVAVLREKTGKDISIRHYNKQKYTEDYEVGSRSIIDKINDIYAEDFEIFGMYLDQK